MNEMRDLMWKQDFEKFLETTDKFLGIVEKHNIVAKLSDRVMYLLLLKSSSEDDDRHAKYTFHISL